MFTTVHIVNGQMAERFYSYTVALEYDRYGRIIHQFDPTGTYTFLDQTYSYDAAGNLINGATYDRKLNFRRTNWVWMFIDRDFSVNNPFKAYSYNNGGLPIHFIPFSSLETGDSGFLTENPYTEGWITYQLR